MLKTAILVLLFSFFSLALAQDSPPSGPEVEQMPPFEPKSVEVAPQDTPAPANPRTDNDQPRPETKAPSASGEKIFDWSKHEGETEVHHPFAEKGLIRITKDREYIYRVDETPTKRAMSVQVGLLNPTELKNPDDTTGHATFKDNYDQSSNPTVLLTREWDLWKSAIGRVNIRGGTGVFVAQGHGHFVSEVNAQKTPLEVFTFIAFPESVGAVYRMKFTDHQLFVPYAEGGGTAFAFTEIRDDNKGPKFGGALAAYAAAGLSTSLTYFDYMARISMNREYGISAVYLTLEYRKIVGLTRYDFSSDFFNGGFLMEY